MQVSGRISAQTVQQIIEEHLNRSLAGGKQARLVRATPNYELPQQDNRSTLQLDVTFEIIDRR